MKGFIEQIDLERTPQHVAIIMDGNGRWARSHGQGRTAGHEAGVATVRRITEIANDLKIKYLTLYTFSTENWNRPKEEVDALMNLVVAAIEQETPDLIKNNVRLTAIGDIDALPDFARNKLIECQENTAHCTGLNLCMALSYSGRWEITHAAKNIAEMAKQGMLEPEDVDEQLVSSLMDTAPTPDPDLLIRTGGELRISNFLLWQLAYAELYFTDIYWPDFSKDDFCQAIIDYQHRQRRYGKTGEQVSVES